MNPPWSTVGEMVAAQATRLGDQPAILSPGQTPLTFSRLHEQIQQIRQDLWDLGIGRGDIVASVLPNGPVAATAVVGASSSATLALLNPDAQASEYETLFRELEPKIVLALPGHAQPARETAGRMSIPVADVAAATEAGFFRLDSNPPHGKSSRIGQLAQGEDLAYIIATSGTTARPKLVPLTHRAACHTMSSAADALALTPADRCLNFSPLFHLLGFMSSLLLPLAGGGSSVCTPGFHLQDFFRWLDEFQPTWFCAVPAVLQEILELSSSYAAVLGHSRIRFLRTGGSPLPPSVLKKIETAFGAPLLQVYALSESPVIAMDRFSAERRDGSCGRPSCNEVMIVDGDGRRVSPGETGEVAVRGPAVIDGYFRNPEVAPAAFRDGWFHTGDIGYFDADNYLFLTGRASEFINRGGEKISPVEVDRVLMAHPAVAAAVTFPIPHDKLGEQVAAAVVLRDGASATEEQIQEFVAARLAAHKLPRHILFLDELPVGATGKVQRSKMREFYLASPAGKLNSAPRPYIEPRDERERRIAAVLARVLRVERVGVHDNFFDLGGSSLQATECAALLREEFGVKTLNPGTFLYAPTPARLAETIDDPARLEGAVEILPIQPAGKGMPLFLVEPGFEATRLARHLGEDRPVFGVRIREGPPFSHRSINEMAAECAAALAHFHSSGSFALAGWCAAGVVALETARQLERRGGEIAFVAILDVRNPFLPPLSAPHLLWVRLWRRVRRMVFVGWHWPQGLWSHFRDVLRPGTQAPLAENTQALFRHHPEPWSGRMVHIWAAEWPHGRYFDPGFGWNHLAPTGFVFHEVPGNHLTMLQEPNVAQVARILADELDRAPLIHERPQARATQAQ